MPVCESCGKNFAQKGRYEAHLARKRPCGPTVKQEAKEEEKEKEKETKEGLKPFLKWVGGKTQILDAVLERFPSVIHNYHEPFLGGGSVLLGLLEKQRKGNIIVHGTIYASDINPHLIALYQNIQTAVEEVIHHLRQLMEACPVYEEKAPAGVNRKPASAEEAIICTETYYYWIRSQYNAMSSVNKATPLGSAMFLFLNKMCFRGVYREGPNGFNVPFGNYKNPAVFDEEHLRRVSTGIQGVVFRCQSFSDSLSLERAQETDFIYLDPPYAPETSTSFVGYTADGFRDHATLFERCRSLSGRGVGLLMSNADVTLVHEAFRMEDGWKTEKIVCRRAIHSKTPNATTNEVLISNATL